MSGKQPQEKKWAGSKSFRARDSLAHAKTSHVTNIHTKLGINTHNQILQTTSRTKRLELLRNYFHSCLRRDCLPISTCLLITFATLLYFVCFNFYFSFDIFYKIIMNYFVPMDIDSANITVLFHKLTDKEHAKYSAKGRSF
jgi:hypothetical protein